MCYEIGKIYRNGWSDSEAEVLTSTLRKDWFTRTFQQAALGSALYFIPFIGGVISVAAAIFWSQEVSESNLLLLAK